MVYLFGFVMSALLIKDTVPIGDVYVLRGLSQGLALLVGLWWLFTRGTITAIRPYGLLLAYVGILCATAFISMDPTRVLLQVLSLVAVMLFFISFCAQLQTTPDMHTTATRIVLYSLLPVCLGSLLLYKIAPTLAYDQAIERVTWDNAHRFKGLFGKPAGIAAASGILLGLCAFTKTHWLIRAIGAIASMLCLYLTLSRSFWVGAFVALAITVLLYIRHKNTLIIVGIIGLLIALVAINVADTRVPAFNQSETLRSDSLANLSGRTTLWAYALTRFWDHPLLGYGYTVGHHAFISNNYGRSRDSSGEDVALFHTENFSFHNGYVQALLDSGGLGGLLYLVIMGRALWVVVWFDTTKSHAAVVYSLLFLSIANVGETIVFSPAIFHAVYYWYVAILALSLKSPHLPSLIQRTESEPIAGKQETPRFPILSKPSTMLDHTMESTPCDNT